MMRKKKGFELSISMMVMIILGLSMFIMSLVFLNKFFTQADILRVSIDEKTKSDINRLLSSGERVALPIYSTGVQKGETAIFGLGIFNSGDKKNFKIGVRCAGILISEDEPIVDCDDYDWESILMNNKFTLEKNKQELIKIVIPMTEDAGVEEYGTYIFNVYVCNTPGDKQDECDEYDAASLYDSVEKIYVEVN